MFGEDRGMLWASDAPDLQKKCITSAEKSIESRDQPCQAHRVAREAGSSREPGDPSELRG